MSKESFIATSAISLRCILLKEDDQRILTLFTRELGLVSLIIKKLNPKDHNKRMLTSTLIKGHYLLRPSKSDLFYLSDGHIEDAYLPLRSDLEKLQFAGQMAGAILHTQWDSKPQEHLFDLLTSYLHCLKEFPSPQTLYLSFLLKLLRHEGLLPAFDSCGLCYQTLPTRFTEGKLCCQKCSSIPRVMQKLIDSKAGTQDFSQALPPSKQALFLDRTDAAGLKDWDANAKSTQLLNHEGYKGIEISYDELQVLAILTYATQFTQLKEIPISANTVAIVKGIYLDNFPSCKK